MNLPFIAVPGSVKYKLIFKSLIQQGFCRGLLYLTRQRTAIIWASTSLSPQIPSVERSRNATIQVFSLVEIS